MIKPTEVAGVRYPQWRARVLASFATPSERTVSAAIVAEIAAERSVDGQVAGQFVTALHHAFGLIDRGCRAGSFSDEVAADVSVAMQELLVAHSRLDGQARIQPYLYNEYSIWVAAIEQRYSVLVPGWRKLRPLPLTYPMR